MKKIGEERGRKKKLNPQQNHLNQQGTQITVKTYPKLFTSYVTLFKFEEDWTGEGGGEELKELGRLMVRFDLDATELDLIKKADMLAMSEACKVKS